MEINRSFHRFWKLKNTWNILEWFNRRAVSCRYTCCSSPLSLGCISLKDFWNAAVRVGSIRSWQLQRILTTPRVKGMPRHGVRWVRKPSMEPGLKEAFPSRQLHSLIPVGIHDSKRKGRRHSRSPAAEFRVYSTCRQRVQIVVFFCCNAEDIHRWYHRRCWRIPPLSPAISSFLSLVARSIPPRRQPLSIVFSGQISFTCTFYRLVEVLLHDVMMTRSGGVQDRSTNALFVELLAL